MIWLTRGWTPLTIVSFDRHLILFTNGAEREDYILPPEHPQYPGIVEMILEDACEIGGLPYPL